MARVRRWVNRALGIVSPSEPRWPRPPTFDPRPLPDVRWPLPDVLRVCHCLCGKIHPQAPGVCQAMNAVTTRTLASPLGGQVEVPLCWPCAVASSREACRG